MPRPMDPKTIDNDQLVVSTCDASHRAEQARLFNACFKKDLGERELNWRYDGGPHGGALSVVSRPPGGEAISGYACSPRRVLCHGQDESLVGETGDVMTHPDWRKRGIFSALDRACMQAAGEAGWSIVFGLPNRRSAHIFLELGWERIGTIRPWTFVLTLDERARALRLPEGRLAALALPLTIRECQAGERRLRRAAGALRATPADRFPDQVEALSKRVEPKFPFMVRRDAPYLNWRFVDNPSGVHRLLLVHRENGELAGYAVVQVPDERGLGYLVDVLAPEQDARAAAFVGALDRLRELGASAVQATAIDGSWWSGRLFEAGFLRPKSENYLTVIRYVHDPEHPLSGASADASTWYLTDGDRDDETMG
ncbi:MAG: GNAT family N-acetyltransferase [Planctomycetota bacterium]